MVSRRRLLRVAPFPVVAVAGCLDDGDGGSDATRTRRVSPQPTRRGTEEPTPTDVPTGTTPAATATPTGTSTPVSTPPSTTVATATVRISGGAFDPRRLSVAPDTLVRWVNDDPDSHRIASMRVDDSTPWEFTSRSFDRGGSVRYRFGSQGVYAYFSPTWGRSTSCGLVRVGGAAFDGDLPCESGY